MGPRSGNIRIPRSECLNYFLNLRRWKGHGCCTLMGGVVRRKEQGGLLSSTLKGKRSRA